MERARKIGTFWNWLPTFRAVAETEHVGRAAASLGLSSPAVSRTVGLLEEELGVELLERDGRGLRLTEAGRILLVAVRDAMRTVHEASLRFERSGFIGELRVSSVTPTTQALLHPALETFRRTHPGIVIRHSLHPIEGIHRALRSGDLDVALLRSSIKPEGIEVEQLGETPVRVYAPVSYRLGAKKKVSFDFLEPYPFVALAPTHGDDLYPISAKRKVILLAETFEEARRSALQLNALVVLPKGMAGLQDGSKSLEEVRTPALRSIPLCIAWRSPLALSTASDALVEAVLDTARAKPGHQGC